MASKRKKTLPATASKKGVEGAASAAGKARDPHKNGMDQPRGAKPPTLVGDDESSASIPVHKSGFPIVGIGASAGGLEALEELLDAMPANTGMAFVVVTHQHPGHTSLLPELLGKETEMKVVEAADGTKVEPNRVYVGPPAGNLAILNGVLHRMDTAKKEEVPRLSIDYFFRSLA
jgi:two-component system, chemotaxis family, CheB/CheR fusion protein